jgi:hypothetical protein
MEMPGADNSQALDSTVGAAVVLLIFFFDDLGEFLRTLPSVAGTSFRDPSRGFGASRAMLLS